MCEIAIEDIAGSCEPMGGVAAVIYYAKVSDFITIQEPPAIDAAADFAAMGTIAVDHVFNEGKFFNKITGVTLLGTIKSTQGGERNRRVFTNELTFQIAGSKPAVLGFARAVKNGEFIMIAVEIGSGQARQFGSKRLPATFTAQEQNIEAAAEGLNALNCTVQDMQTYPAPVYTGVVADA